jgi:hypothetical protein
LSLTPMPGETLAKKNGPSVSILLTQPQIRRAARNVGAIKQLFCGVYVMALSE